MLEGSSPIASFYPHEVKIDVKKGGPEWHNVVLLDFIGTHNRLSLQVRAFFLGVLSSFDDFRPFPCLHPLSLVLW